MHDRGELFEELAFEVAEPLRRYVARRTDPDTVQDVVADTFLVLWRRLDDVPESGALPWCYAVARLCLNNAQRAQRRQRGLLARVAMLDAPRSETAPDDSVADIELHEALSRLSEDDRELLRLWAWESLTPTEISTVLGISANAVSIRLHRARKRLLAQLATPAGNAHDPPGHREVQERRPP